MNERITGNKVRNILQDLDYYNEDNDIFVE